MDETTRNFTLAWLGGIPIAILNAAIRNYLFQPYTNELLAHQISSFTIIILFAIYFFWLNKLWPIDSTQQAITIGIIWLTLTIIFEFLFGRYVMGHSWTYLLQDYNIMSGRLWSLVLVWTIIGPYTIYKVTK